MKTYLTTNGEFRFNDPVVVEMTMGIPDEKRTGRLVQVRRRVGAFGSDLYFIRLRDGTLLTFENVLIRRVDDAGFVEAFYLSNGRTPPAAPPQPAYEGDSETATYSIRDEFPETGFIIEKPAQPASPVQSFTMRITQAND